MFSQVLVEKLLFSLIIVDCLINIFFYILYSTVQIESRTFPKIKVKT